MSKKVFLENKKIRLTVGRYLRLEESQTPYGPGAERLRVGDDDREYPSWGRSLVLEH